MSSRPAMDHASRARVLWWGATRRCPRCGAGHLYRKYFRLVDDCPGCGLHFEREQGYWAGALAVNTIVAGGVFAVVFVTMIVLTIPNVPVLPLIMLLTPIATLAPIIYYPYSKTMWMAIDRAFLQRLDPREQRDEQPDEHRDKGA